MDVYIVGSDSDSDDYLGIISDKPAVYLILGRTGFPGHFIMQTVYRTQSLPCSFVDDCRKHIAH